MKAKFTKFYFIGCLLSVIFSLNAQAAQSSSKDGSLREEIVAGKECLSQQYQQSKSFEKEGHIWSQDSQEGYKIKFKSETAKFIIWTARNPLSTETVTLNSGDLNLCFKYFHNYEDGRRDFSYWMTDRNLKPYGSIAARYTAETLDVMCLLDQKIDDLQLANALDLTINYFRSFKGLDFKKFKINFDADQKIVYFTKKYPKTSNSPSFIEAFNAYTAEERQQIENSTTSWNHNTFVMIDR